MANHNRTVGVVLMSSIICAAIGLMIRANLNPKNANSVKNLRTPALLLLFFMAVVFTVFICLTDMEARESIRSFLKCPESDYENCVEVMDYESFRDWGDTDYQDLKARYDTLLAELDEPAAGVSRQEREQAETAAGGAQNDAEQALRDRIDQLDRDKKDLQDRLDTAQRTQFDLPENDSNRLLVMRNRALRADIARLQAIMRGLTAQRTDALTRSNALLPNWESEGRLRPTGLAGANTALREQLDLLNQEIASLRNVRTPDQAAIDSVDITIRRIELRIEINLTIISEMEDTRGEQTTVDEELRWNQGEIDASPEASNLQQALNEQDQMEQAITRAEENVEQLTGFSTSTEGPGGAQDGLELIDQQVANEIALMESRIRDLTAQNAQLTENLRVKNADILRLEADLDALAGRHATAREDVASRISTIEQQLGSEIDVSPETDLAFQRDLINAEIDTAEDGASTERLESVRDLIQQLIDARAEQATLIETQTEEIADLNTTIQGLTIARDTVETTIGNNNTEIAQIQNADITGLQNLQAANDQMMTNLRDTLARVRVERDNFRAQNTALTLENMRLVAEVEQLRNDLAAAGEALGGSEARATNAEARIATLEDGRDALVERMQDRIDIIGEEASSHQTEIDEKTIAIRRGEVDRLYEGLVKHRGILGIESTDPNLSELRQLADQYYASDSDPPMTAEQFTRAFNRIRQGAAGGSITEETSRDFVTTILPEITRGSNLHSLTAEERSALSSTLGGDLQVDPTTTLTRNRKELLEALIRQRADMQSWIKLVEACGPDVATEEQWTNMNQGNTDLADIDDQISGLITENDRTLNELKSDVAGLRRGLAVQTAEVERVRGELATEKENVDTLTTDLAAANGRISEKDALIRGLEQQIAEREFTSPAPGDSEEVTRLREDLRTEEAEANRLRGELRTEEAEVTRLREDLRLANAADSEEVTRLRGELRTEEAEVTRLREDLRLANAADSEEVTRLRGELRTEEAEVTRLREDLRLANAADSEEVTRLREDLRTEEAEVTRLREDLQTATAANSAEVTRLRGELRAANAADSAEVTRLRGQLRTANADLSAEQEARRAAETLLGEAEASERAAEAELRQERELYRDLQDTLEREQREHATALAAQASTHTAELSRLNAAILELLQQADQSGGGGGGGGTPSPTDPVTAENIEARIADLEAQRTASATKISELESDLRAEVAARQADAEELNQEITSLTEENSELTTENADLVGLHQQVATLTANLASANATIERLQNANADLLAAHDQELSELQALIDSRGGAATAGATTAVGDSTTSTEALRVRIQDLLAENARLTTANEGLESQRGLNNANIATLEQQKLDLEAEIGVQLERVRVLEATGAVGLANLDQDEQQALAELEQGVLTHLWNMESGVAALIGGVQPGVAPRNAVSGELVLNVEELTLADVENAESLINDLGNLGRRRMGIMRDHDITARNANLSTYMDDVGSRIELLEQQVRRARALVEARDFLNASDNVGVNSLPTYEYEAGETRTKAHEVMGRLFEVREQLLRADNPELYTGAREEVEAQMHAVLAEVSDENGDREFRQIYEEIFGEDDAFFREHRGTATWQRFQASIGFD